MKTLIGIPCMSTMHTRFVSSLMGMNRIGQTHIDFKIGSLVYDSRNQLLVEAIQEGADRILMIDSDMRFDPDLMERLSADLDRDGVDLVSALCFRRRIDTDPVIYQKIEPPAVGKDGVPKIQIETYRDYPENQLFQIAGCGFGCVMFKTEIARQAWDRFGPPFAPFNWTGEDISFCKRFGDVGGKMFCDSSILVGHIGEYEYGEKEYKEKRKLEKISQASGGDEHQTLD